MKRLIKPEDARFLGTLKRRYIYQITQNIIRVEITLLIAIPIVLLSLLPALPLTALLGALIWGILSNSPLEPETNVPLWLQITIGAFVGGLIFSPANAIGNLMWGLLRDYAAREIPIPDAEADLSSAKWKNYIKMRKEAISTPVVILCINSTMRVIKNLWKIQLGFFVVCLLVAVGSTITLGLQGKGIGFSALPIWIVLLLATYWVAFVGGLGILFATTLKIYVDN